MTKRSVRAALTTEAALTFNASTGVCPAKDESLRARTRGPEVLTSNARIVGANIGADSDIAVLQEATRSGHVLDQIDRATEGTVPPSKG
jgi:hypothetical protein